MDRRLRSLLTGLVVGACADTHVDLADYDQTCTDDADWIRDTSARVSNALGARRATRGPGLTWPMASSLWSGGFSRRVWLARAEAPAPSCGGISRPPALSTTTGNASVACGDEDPFLLCRGRRAGG